MPDRPHQEVDTRRHRQLHSSRSQEVQSGQSKAPRAPRVTAFRAPAQTAIAYPTPVGRQRQSQVRLLRQGAHRLRACPCRRSWARVRGCAAPARTENRRFRLRRWPRALAPGKNATERLQARRSARHGHPHTAYTDTPSWGRITPQFQGPPATPGLHMQTAGVPLAADLMRARRTVHHKHETHPRPPPPLPAYA